MQNDYLSSCHLRLLMLRDYSLDRSTHNTSDAHRLGDVDSIASQATSRVIASVQLRGRAPMSLNRKMEGYRVRMLFRLARVLAVSLVFLAHGVACVACRPPTLLSITQVI